MSKEATAGGEAHQASHPETDDKLKPTTTAPQKAACHNLRHKNKQGKHCNPGDRLPASLFDAAGCIGSVSSQGRVYVLRWVFPNRLHPKPTNPDKHQLCLHGNRQ